MLRAIIVAKNLVLPIALFLLFGCGTPTPTPTPKPPTPTPATPEGRVDAYYHELNTSMALLRRYNQYMIEAMAEDDEVFFWMQGPSFYLTMRIIDKMPVPSSADLEAVGMVPQENQPTLLEAHDDLLRWLWPCREVGYVGMRLEDYTTEELMAVHVKCNQILSDLEDAYPNLFICPEGEPLCAIANRE